MEFETGARHLHPFRDQCQQPTSTSHLVTKPLNLLIRSLFYYFEHGDSSFAPRSVSLSKLVQTLNKPLYTLFESLVGVDTRPRMERKDADVTSLCKSAILCSRPLLFPAPHPNPSPPPSRHFNSLHLPSPRCFRLLIYHSEERRHRRNWQSPTSLLGIGDSTSRQVSPVFEPSRDVLPVSVAPSPWTLATPNKTTVSNRRVELVSAYWRKTDFACEFFNVTGLSLSRRERRRSVQCLSVQFTLSRESLSSQFRIFIDTLWPEWPYPASCLPDAYVRTTPGSSFWAISLDFSSNVKCELSSLSPASPKESR